MLIRSSEFIISNTDHRLCPNPDLPEFAFIGRSNVGKSSLINMLCTRKNLAKTSGAPGKTRLINHFLINREWYLVDLPGYGYAKISKKERLKWEGMIRSYLLNRANLMLTFVLIDVRIKPQEMDIKMINWFGTNKLSVAIIYTKTDKVNQNTSANNINAFEQELQKHWNELPPSFISSSKTTFGKDKILSFIDETSKYFTIS